MIEYRPFRNPDPPQIMRLWHVCRLGRGAAEGFSSDALETLVFSQSYFDPSGLILACEGKRIVGCVHAGFGPDSTGQQLSHDIGVVCLLLVHPEYRRQGIARELLHRAEHYLKAAGATTIEAGQAPPRTPFYVGLYGGTQPAGFFLSDPDADPFFQAVGYQPSQRWFVFQRQSDQGGFPMNFKLLGIRRKHELTVTDQPDEDNWWWSTRFGRLDTIQFLLRPKTGGEAIALATALGLDFYIPKWQQRAVGLLHLTVQQEQERTEFTETLISEMCKRLRDELITLIEVQAEEQNQTLLQLLQATGFSQVDTGIVYRRAES